MKKYVLLSMVSREKLTKEPYGRNILELFYNNYKNLAPEYCNYWEPINKPIHNIEIALELWNEKIFLCRRKHSVKMYGRFSLNGYNISHLKTEYDWKKDIAWFSFFKDIIIKSKSYFGYIHLFTDNEMSIFYKEYAQNCFAVGTPWSFLQKSIPQLAWANYFGEEYVKELDLPLIKQHGFDINPLGDGYVFNITDNIEDVITNYDYFNARRQKLKSLFRPGLFQNYARYEHESKPICP